MKKWTSAVQNMFANPVLFGSTVVSASLFIASIFSYILQVLLARYLSVEDYGIFNVLLSISVIFSVFSGVLSTSLIKTTSELKSTGQFKKLTELFIDLIRWIFLSTILLVITSYIFRDLLANFFQISEPVLFVYLSILVASSLINVVPASYLQGFLRFKAFSLYNILYGMLRTALPFTLLLMFNSLKAIFIGLSLSTVFAFIVGTLLLKKNFHRYEKEGSRDLFKKIANFGGPVLLITLGMMALNNIDLVLVKRFFNDYETGIYSGVITIGKVFLFGASTIPVIMLPQISEAYYKNSNVLSVFYNFLTIQFFIIVMGLIVFIFFPTQITLLMFGSKFIDAIPYIPEFSIFIALYILINFLTTFFLGIGETNVYVLHIVAVALQIFFVQLFNDSLSSIILVNVSVCLFLLISLVIFFMKTIKNKSMYNMKLDK